MPSLWPYLESIDSSKHFLAYVVAIYSIGEALGALYFGHTTQYETTRTTLNKSAAAGTFGALLYVTAALLPFPQWCVFVSRFFMGFMTGGSQAVQQVYLADVLPESQLTATTVTLNAYACLGFVIGPAFGLLTGFIPNFSAWGLQFNQLTAPGYFVFASGIVCLALYTFVLDEEGDRASGKSPESSTEDAPLYETSVSCEAVVDMEEASSLLGNGDAMPGKMPMEADMAALVVCNIAFFIHFYGFALQETITTYVAIPST